jgi:8-oxo-dGTP pyrophosphatase MutT (NUDIX family)
MVREISAGGVVIRKREGEWWMAAIEPPTECGREAARRSKASRSKPAPSKPLPRHSIGRKIRVLTLPKGLVDPGEKPLESALREVYEETGVTADLIAKLGDSKYVYTRAWGDGQRVFKIVSFYLMRYRSGRINDISPEMRIEVARARWIRLSDAAKLLAYGGEKQMARRALDYVKANPEL